MSKSRRDPKEHLIQPIDSMMLKWTENPPPLDDLDGYYCAVCGQPVGWQIDTDDFGQPCGGFVAYLLATIVDSARAVWHFRYCEDCTVHTYQEMGL